MTTETKDVIVRLRSSQSHPNQAAFIDSEVKRIVVRVGRRGGKTVGAATRNVKRFLEGRRQLYTAPTAEQLGKWWFEVKRALAELVREGVLKQNETEHYIEKPGTEQRIKGKTAWNADSLRGDYADDLTFDEWQLTNEDAWEVVGMPMLLDNNGDAVFLYTPPSLRSVGVSKAKDPRHAAKMFAKARENKSGRWQAIHFTSHDNPFISREALDEIVIDMSRATYLQEILAEDDEIQLSWLVYRAFNESVCKIDDFEIPPNWLIYSGHDFGGANPAALFVAQDPATGNFYEFKEYLPGSGKSTAQHVEEFKQIICLPGEYGKEFPNTYRVLWRSGGSHQEGKYRSDFTSQGWPIIEPNITGPGSVGVQLDRTFGLMDKNRIFVFKSLHRRLEELNNCLWLPDKEGRPTDKIKDEPKYHLSACARYLYSNFRPEAVYSGKEPAAVSNM